MIISSRRPIRATRGAFLLATVGAAALAAVLVAATAAPASAQRRPDTLTMTCQQVGALVRAQGAIVLGTGPHIFDRYVADGRFCSLNEVAAPSPLRTRDAARCLSANRCVPRRDYWEDNFFWR
jgi:hypothetical protein